MGASKITETGPPPPAGGGPELAETVRRAQAGDQAAFERLAETFWEDIFRMVYFRTFSRPDAEDLTQDIFIKAFARLGQLSNPAAFKAWLFTLAVNKTRDFLRRRRLRDFLFPAGQNDDPEGLGLAADPGPSALDSVLKKEFEQKLREFLVSLSRLEREVFSLRFLDGLAIKEIAAVLGGSEGAVKTHLHRALVKFRRRGEMMALLRGYRDDD